MRQCWGDGINPMAAWANATQWGAGYSSDPSFPRRVRAGTPGNSPLQHPQRGDCGHVKRYVAVPPELAPVNSGAFFGLRAQAADNPRTDCTDAHKVGLSRLDERTVGRAGTEVAGEEGDGVEP